MDRLIEAIEAKQNPSVVGLDPTEALVPAQIVAGFAEEISEQVEDPAEAPSMQLSVAFFEFNRAFIENQVNRVAVPQNKIPSQTSCLRSNRRSPCMRRSVRQASTPTP